MAPLSSMPARMRTGSLGKRRRMENTIKLTSINVGIMLRKRRIIYFRTGSLLYLTRSPLHPKIPRPYVPIPAHGILVTAAGGGDMTADVIDPQHGRNILPDVLQGDHLHLLVDVDGLVHAWLPSGQIQQTIELSLHLEIVRIELVTLVLAEERAIAVLPCGL